MMRRLRDRCKLVDEACWVESCVATLAGGWMLPWLGISLRPFSARSLITTCLDLVSFVLFWFMRMLVQLWIWAEHLFWHHDLGGSRFPDLHWIAYYVWCWWLVGCSGFPWPTWCILISHCWPPYLAALVVLESPLPESGYHQRMALPHFLFVQLLSREIVSIWGGICITILSSWLSARFCSSGSAAMGNSMGIQKGCWSTASGDRRGWGGAP